MRPAIFCMSPIRPSHLIGRVAGVLAGLAGLLASLTTGPAAFAAQLRPDPPWWITHLRPPVHLQPAPGYFKHPPLPDPARVHAAVGGGIPGWQITLIAVSAAVLASTAILLGRALAARRHRTVPSSVTNGQRRERRRGDRHQARGNRPGARAGFRPR